MNGEIVVHCTHSHFRNIATSTSTSGQGERREKYKKARVAHKFRIRRKYSYNIIIFLSVVVSNVCCVIFWSVIWHWPLCAVLPSRNNKSADECTDYPSTAFTYNVCRLVDAILQCTHVFEWLMDGWSQTFQVTAR